MRGLSALVLVLLTGSVLYAATIDGTAAVNPNPVPAPPAGKKAVNVSGKYTINAGDKVNKIESSYYTTDPMGNLKFEGSATDPNFAKAAYTTTDFVATGGTSYTVITRIYINGNLTTAAAQTITTITP